MFTDRETQAMGTQNVTKTVEGGDDDDDQQVMDFVTLGMFICGT